MRRLRPIGSWPPKYLGHERLAHDRHGLAVLTVALVERTAADDRDTQRLEIAWADRVEPERHVLVLPGRVPIDREVIPDVHLPEGKVERERRRSHTGDACDGVSGFREEAASGRFVVVSEAQVDGHDERAGHVEPRVDTPHIVEASDGESARDEQHRRQRNLGDHQPVAEARARTCLARPPVVPERTEQAAPHAECRRHDAGRDRARHRQRGRIGEHPPIERDLQRQRHLDDDRLEAQEEVDGPGRKQQTEGAARKREQQGLGDELPHHAGARRAQ